MAKATGIDHVVIYVADMEDAKKFFIEGLGLTEYADYGDEFFMSAGKQKIALFEGENKDQTVDHIALNVDDIDELKTRLKKMGYSMRSQDTVNGPNGIRIQLVR